MKLIRKYNKNIYFYKRYINDQNDKISSCVISSLSRIFNIIFKKKFILKDTKKPLEKISVLLSSYLIMKTM